jgi:hypothetical protein
VVSGLALNGVRALSLVRAPRSILDVGTSYTSTERKDGGNGGAPYTETA